MISIQGIRVSALSAKTTEAGKLEIEAAYEIVAANNRVLATTSLTNNNIYGGKSFTPSPQTINAINQAIALYKADVETDLGISEDSSKP